MSRTPTFVRGKRGAPDAAPAATASAEPGRRTARRRGAGPRAAKGARRRPDLTALTGRLTAARTRIVTVAAPAVAAAKRRLAPWASMVSPLGWVVLVGTVGAAFLGWTRGWVELRTLAVMLLALLVGAVLFTLGRWEYTAVIELGNKRVKIGDLALGRVEVRNASSSTTSASRVELPVGRNVAPFRVPRLAPGAAHEEMFQVPTRRRGIIVIGPVRSVRTDPLALLHRQRTWTDPVELFVHPDTVLLDTRAVGFLKDVEGTATQNLSSSDVSFHALREYVPGDDRRAIHWRTTARIGKLMVRQFEETMRSHLLLLLSLNPADYADADEFELAVSALGSLGQAAIREERQLSIYTSGGPLEYPSAVGLLDELCRLQLRPGAQPLAELAAQAAARVPGASVVSVIVGSTVPPATLRGAQLALPPEVTTFGLRCGRTLSAARRKASTLVVLDVGNLTDLQRGLRTLK